ncbi:uncharacterized protein LOC126839378 [Adelges cooleyi]|uniref:uncharacterized protein LOC126839378 n=1 Tax=Adelges cooleyi TaxID=133065 RepID=UPI00218031F4|nr:uncharacterized protein LOC126839378 [Adelges cooleyi]
MMELIDSYVVASQIVLRADSSDPSSWQELHTLLPHLHDGLSCQTCKQLVNYPSSHPNGLLCSACTNVKNVKEDTWSILQYYKKLCSFIHKSPLFNVMLTRVEDKKIVELVTEAIHVPKPINGYNGFLNISRPNLDELERQNNDELHLPSDFNISVDNKTSKGFFNILSDIQTPNDRKQAKPVLKIISKKKVYKKAARHCGCRCGNATSSPGKLTCFGQRCPCYIKQKACDRCKCRGCRNPKSKPSNNGDIIEMEKIRRKPVTLELVSSLNTSLVKNKPVTN